MSNYKKLIGMAVGAALSFILGAIDIQLSDPELQKAQVAILTLDGGYLAPKNEPT